MKNGVEAPLKAKKLALHMLPGSLLAEQDLTGGRWYDCAPEWPKTTLGGDVRPTPAKKPKKETHPSLEEWWEVGETALGGVSKAYEKRMSRERGKNGRTGKSFLNSVAEKGTLSDKLAAITLKVQESPLHHMDELQVLFESTEKGGRKERGPAIDALSDLLVNDLLPDGRRLVAFERLDFSAGVKAITKRHIAYAIFESQLKSMYGRFLKVLDECSNDLIVYFKQKAVRLLFDLLCAKPENEGQLLAMLVNKLGDPEKKVASLASYCLTQLMYKHHPAMKTIVVKEVDEFLHRPNVNRRAQYYAVSFLNQMRFTKSDEDVELTRRLLKVYMSLFAACITQDQRTKPVSKADSSKTDAPKTIESRLMGAVLTGINRAFPYTNAEENDVDYDKEFDALFKVAHAQSLGSATQALRFLFKVAQARQTVSDRYYRALYSRLSDLCKASETKQAMFINLLVQSMKVDVSPSRVRAFAKRLLQSAFSASPGYAAGVLLVISEVLMIRKNLLQIAITAPEVEEDLSTEDRKNSPSSILKADVSAEKRMPSVKSSISMYDPDKRDPQYAGAENSCLWELVALTNHYHPSVAKFALQLVQTMKRLKYPGDPLKDFAQSSFLDRFCYKKPKRNVIESLHGRRAARIRNQPLVNSDAFLNMGENGQVAEEDKFYVRYFQSNPSKVQKHDFDVDGERSDDEMELAYESAIRSEMKRINDSQGGGHADVDENDPDELEALENAFKEEFEKVPDNGSHDGDESEPGELLGEPDEVLKEKAMSNIGSFAPAEDYEDYLEKDDSSSSSDHEEDSESEADVKERVPVKIERSLKVNGKRVRKSIQKISIASRKPKKRKLLKS